MNRFFLPGWWRRDRPQWSATAHQRIGIPTPHLIDWGLWAQELAQDRTTS